MFTGLVEGMGRLVRMLPKGPDAELVVNPPWPAKDAVIGESVAINGACLTVTRTEGENLCFDTSRETLSRTTLGGLKPGDRLNLERALKLGDRLGGHLVTGHIDCVGVVAGVENLGQSTILRIGLPKEHLAYVVEKGSVALDGVSLTVNSVEGETFSLNIIPHTLAATTTGLVKQGDSVNIETDIIGKYVSRLLNRDEPLKGGDGAPGGGVTLESLKEAGF